MKSANRRIQMLLLAAIMFAMVIAMSIPAFAVDPATFIPGATGYIGSGTILSKTTMYDRVVRGGKKICVLAKGTKVNVRQFWGSMLLVDTADEDLQQGFIAADKLNADFEVQYEFAATKKAPVYSQPAASKKNLVSTLAKGDIVMLKGIRGKWAVIAFGDIADGYVLFKSLRTVES